MREREEIGGVEMGHVTWSLGHFIYFTSTPACFCLKLKKNLGTVQNHDREKKLFGI